MPTGQYLFLAFAILTLAGPKLAFGQDIPWSLPRNYEAPPGPYDPQRRYVPRNDTGYDRRNAGTQARNADSAGRYGDYNDARDRNRNNGPINSGQRRPGDQYEWVLVPRGSTIPPGSIRGKRAPSGRQPLRQVEPRRPQAGTSEGQPAARRPKTRRPETRRNETRRRESRGHVVPSFSVGRIDQRAQGHSSLQLGNYPPLDRDPTRARPRTPPAYDLRDRQRQPATLRQPSYQYRPPDRPPPRQSWPYQNQQRQTRPAYGSPNGYGGGRSYGGGGQLPNEFSGPSTFANPYGYGNGGMSGAFGHPFLSGLPRY